MHKVSKIVAEQIRKIAAQLPQYTTATVEVIDGVSLAERYTAEAAKAEDEGDLKLADRYRNLCGTIDPKAKYKVRGATGTVMAINHERRMRAAYAKDGNKGLLAYLNKHVDFVKAVPNEQPAEGQDA